MSHPNSNTDNQIDDESQRKADKKKRKEEKRKRKEQKKKEKEERKKNGKSEKEEEEGSTRSTGDTEQASTTQLPNEKETQEKQEKEEPRSNKKSKKRNREETEEQERVTKKKKTESGSPSSTATSPAKSNFLSDDMEKLDSWRDKQSMTVDGDVTNWKPIESFTESGFAKELLEITKGFKQPTPIQSQCWPIALAGRDLVGIAETGSGKTLTFGLPGLSYVLKNKTKSKTHSPLMLVLAPTRELAVQSSEVLISAGKPANIRVLCMYGGVAKNGQRDALREGVQVIVATPGRLKDFIQEGACSLSEVSYLVLDEADRMLDLGFEKDIREIIGMIPKTRQTLMFSATWPEEVRSLASQFLSNPIKVTIGTAALTANKNVKQIVEVIDQHARDKRLLELLRNYHKSRKNKVLIFVLYKAEASRISNFLYRNGWNNESIHGDKTQIAREQALASFTSGEIPLLVATDVAARGLDIPKVEYVINYSFPLTIQDYVHRIGRTGRAGATGIAHTFFQIHDKSHAGELVAVLKEANQEVPESLCKFGVAIKKKEPKLGKISQTNETNKHITFGDSDEEN